MDYRERYENYRTRFETALSSYLKAAPFVSETLKNAFVYSLTAGGKRLRPGLVLASADALGGEESRAMPSALALEMIHTYSLIHDDLPAMDNDDYRRGKLTNHKVFGEGMAILAGDALLNKAYETLFSCGNLAAGRILSSAAGDLGMIGGQAVDLTSEGKTGGEEELFTLQRLKTGKLITAALLLGEQAAKGNTSLKMEELGDKLGVLFQTTDDILDVVGKKEELGKSVGKDEKEQKLTTVSLFGLSGARKVAENAANEALLLLPACGLSTPFFESLIKEMLTRSK